MRVFVTLLLCAGALHAQGGGQVQFRDWHAAAATQKPKVSCESLRALTSYDISIISATTIAATADVPEHCRVSLMIPPEINIEVNMPTAWNGRFYMFGNGGFAGESFQAPGRIHNRTLGLKAGFAVGATDQGHSAAKEPNATFARNRQKLLDYGFRSLHLTAETAKMLLRTYYGDAPSKSYFDGCSQGGREGLIFAERFPTDFDGIVAGSPAIDFTGGNLARAYWLQGLAATPFPAAKLKLLADAEYAKCDAADGLQDGLVSDPLHCDFHADRDLPQCANGVDGPNCFLPSEISAINLIHSDVMSQGKRIFPGWPVGGVAFTMKPGEKDPQSGWVGQELNYADGRPGAWKFYADGFLGDIAFPEGGPALHRRRLQHRSRLRACRRIAGHPGRHRSQPRRIPPAQRQANHVFRLGRSAAQSPPGRGVLRQGSGNNGDVHRVISRASTWCPACSIAAAASAPTCLTP